MKEEYILGILDWGLMHKYGKEKAIAKKKLEVIGKERMRQFLTYLMGSEIFNR